MEVGKRLTSNIRESDTASRIGGNEFTVILNEVKSLNNAKTTALKILKNLQMHFYLITIKENIFIAASIGISLVTEERRSSIYRSFINVKLVERAQPTP